MNQLRKRYILSPVYPYIRNIKNRKEYSQWIKDQKSGPVPHIQKQKNIKTIAQRYGLGILVETGTFLGDMVYAMKGEFETIYSIELSHELFQICQKRFRNYSNIQIVEGDSGILMDRIAQKLTAPALFWLDGHYSSGLTAKGEKSTPIFEELKHIFRQIHQGHKILIDDARLFNGKNDYPSLDDLQNFIKSEQDHLTVDIKYDCIQIL